MLRPPLPPTKNRFYLNCINDTISTTSIWDFGKAFGHNICHRISYQVFRNNKHLHRRRHRHKHRQRNRPNKWFRLHRPHRRPHPMRPCRRQRPPPQWSICAKNISNDLVHIKFHSIRHRIRVAHRISDKTTKATHLTAMWKCVEFFSRAKKRTKMEIKKKRDRRKKRRYDETV